MSERLVRYLRLVRILSLRIIPLVLVGWAERELEFHDETLGLGIRCKEDLRLMASAGLGSSLGRRGAPALASCLGF
jgi:hypothetical protein